MILLKKGIFVLSCFLFSWSILTLFPVQGWAVENPHSLALKLGYHAYPNSDYFDRLASSGFGGQSDYSGGSIELLSYDYRISPEWSFDIDFISGYSTQFSKPGFTNTVTVSYLTFTPKYYFIHGVNDLYGGIGIGSYGTDLKLETLFSIGEEKPGGAGLNLLLGWEHRMGSVVGLLIEDKIIFGKVSTSIGDFNFGGNDLLFGVRFHF